MASAKTLQQARNIADLRKLAARRVPRFSFEYVDGGADDELTVAGNRAAFAEINILPRQLAGISTVDPSVTVLGKRSSLPMVIAPTGYNGLLARDGDLALARTARTVGFPFTQSTMSSSTIEEVAAVLAGGRHWFQLYMLKDPAITRRLVQRAIDAGCEALVLTSDAITLGNREGDKHNYSAPGKLTWRAKLDVAMRWAWLFDVVIPNGPPGFGNLSEFLPKGETSAVDGARFISQQMDQAISWKSVEWLRSIWPGKLIVKGIMRADDAAMAAERGVDAIVVSNHGGRRRSMARRARSMSCRRSATGWVTDAKCFSTAAFVAAAMSSRPWRWARARCCAGVPRFSDLAPAASPAFEGQSKSFEASSNGP